MVNILRVTTKWDGFPGAPGYTNLFFRDFGTGPGTGLDPDTAQAQSAVDRVNTFWSAIRQVFPDDLSLTIQSEVDVLEDTTGELVDSLSVTAPVPVRGSSTSTFSGPVGLVVNWKTTAIRNGRRIRGKTFLVPTVGSIFSTTGGIAAADLVPIKGAADALAAREGTPDLGVWARPSVTGASDGQWAAVTQTSVPALAAVLRSRRD